VLKSNHHSVFVAVVAASFEVAVVTLDCMLDNSEKMDKAFVKPPLDSPIVLRNLR
jgi:hypothetical protein